MTGRYRIMILVMAAAAMLLLSGCRSRVTDIPDTGRTVPDEDGMRQEEYQMRRDELGLYETRESIFSRFSSNDDYDEEEYYDEDFDEMMDDYRDWEEEEYVEPEDTTRPGTGTRPPSTTIRPGRGGRTPSIPTPTPPAVVTVKVTLDANGGHFADEQTQAVIERNTGDPYGELAAPEYEGHSFLGWFTDVENGDMIESDTEVVDANDHTLYAHWKKEAAASSKITFEPGEGTISSGDRVKTVRKGDAYGSFPVVTYDGYDLVGWFTEAEEGTQVSEEDIFEGDEDMTLYAHWTKNAFKYWTSKLNSVTISSDRVNCYIETGDHETTSKSSLIDKSQADNVAGSKDKTVTDEWILDKNPDVVIKVVKKMSDAKSASEEMAARLEGWNGTILVVPEEAVSGNDNEKLYYTVDLCSRLYGYIDSSEVSEARSDLGASDPIYE